MASFSVRWRSSTKKDLRKVPPPQVALMVAAIEQLGINPFPHGSQKLVGSDHTYRIRIGDYRVIYEVGSTGFLVEEAAGCDR